MPAHTKEAQFEADIVASLTTDGGYTEGLKQNFDLTLALDTVELFTFLQTTQPEKWEQLVKRHGGNATTARIKLLARLKTVLDGPHGTLTALRRGVDDLGIRFALCFPRPSSGKNADLVTKYAQNRLTVTRQLRYDTKHANTLDLCLFVNGLPVATAELKNPLTGQGVEDAKQQYKTDRDPTDLLLRRTLVHFAADPRLAFMTTRLARNETEFLPFNLGSDPGRLSCGAGNPPNPNGYATHYLWESVWAYEPWLDLLSRYVTPTPTGGLIFPRFHQWDAVSKLVQHSQRNGAGQSYLVQHSAGSGKSNSIAWLTQELTEAHDPADEPVFSKIIVVTDRRVLDEQLRDTVQLFERQKGAIVTVEGKSGSKSSELASALTGLAKVVTVTVETFPFVLDKLADASFDDQRFAIIVDEAHSSQTGDAANALRQALGSGTDIDDTIDDEDAIAAVLGARGRQPNLSYFAFTATPKHRTVELFGTVNSDGNKQPFHLYTMRQAIDEGFILDVLRNYTTYNTYYRLAATTKEVADQTVDVREASGEIRRFVTKNPALIQQKAAIVVEHFRAHTAHALDGRAKAMVVTASRAAAVKYKQAIDRHIADNHITSVKALVAFSGTVDDDVLGPVTESEMNGFPMSQTALRFKGDEAKGFSPRDFQVLVVAEKFQTGFDEPYLHTMFVDKPLSGLNAVQTLSRLNRIAPGKDETFVLDFVNTAEEIREAFQPYYEAVVTEQTDPNILYDLRTRLFTPDVLRDDEIAAAAEAFYAFDPAKRSLKLIYAAIDPAVERFAVLDVADQADFRDALDRFVRAYSFLSQVMPFVDADLERLYVYGKALNACLPTRTPGSLDLGSDLVLTHLRIEQAGTTDLPLIEGQIDVGLGFPGAGAPGRPGSGTFDQLAAVIADVNARYGADLDDRDVLEVEKLHARLRESETLRTFALANTEENYGLEFEAVFRTELLGQIAQNERFYDLLRDQPDIGAAILQALRAETYREFRQEVEE